MHLQDAFTASISAGWSNTTIHLHGLSSIRLVRQSDSLRKHMITRRLQDHMAEIVQKSRITAFSDNSLLECLIPRYTSRWGKNSISLSYIPTTPEFSYTPNSIKTPYIIARRLENTFFSFVRKKKKSCFN